MSLRRHRRIAHLMTGVALVLLVGTSAGAHAPGAGAAPPQHPAQEGHQGPVSVTGDGGGVLQFESFKGDRINFRVRATADVDDPVGVTGRFDVTHVRPDGTVLADFGGTVDCLMVGGDVAVATGIITRGGVPGIEGDELGRRVGITIADHGRRDRIGWSWLVMGFFQDVPGCLSTAPFFEVTRGRFSVTAP